MCFILTAKGNINKSLVTFAANRGIELEFDSASETVRFWEVEQDSEWMFSYQIDMNGGLVWNANIYLPASTKEELPYWIETEAMLKRVIDYVYRDFLKNKLAMKS